MFSQEHPTLDQLQSFISGDGKHAPKVVRHLLGGCRSCTQVLGALVESQPSLRWLRPAPELRDATHSSPAHDYSAVLARAEETLSYFLVGDQPTDEPPGALLAELLVTSPEIPGLANGSRRRAIPSLVRWLLKRSHTERYSSPESMLHWARLAYLAADSCSAEIAGSRERLADLKARAWGQFGNALRVAGRMREAEEALALADRNLAAGTGDPEVRARLFEQTTSLYIFQRRLQDAREASAEAGSCYQDIGDLHRVARTLVQRAIAFIYAAEPLKAIRCLKTAFPLIDSDRDPRLLLAARHNLACCYIELNRPDEALAPSWQARKVQSGSKDYLLYLRATWREAILLYERGFPEAAKEALLQARQGFLGLGLAYEVAIVSLDLSCVYQRLGLEQEARNLTSETLPIFRALRVVPETVASLIQLHSPGVPSAASG